MGLVISFYNTLLYFNSNIYHIHFFINDKNIVNNLLFLLGLVISYYNTFLFLNNKKVL